MEVSEGIKQMNIEQKRAYTLQMQHAEKEYRNGNFGNCFYYLERAHILGQRKTRMHLATHWWMLKVAIRTLNGKEIFGQLTRIVASLLFSRIWVPLGNTGGANVSPLKRMPIPKEFEKYFAKHEY